MGKPFCQQSRLFCFIGYAYSAVQASTKCVCASDYNMYAPLRDTSCGMVCSGDLTQNCGGEMALSVYSTAQYGKSLSVHSIPVHVY